MSCFMFFEREEREKEMRQTPIDLAGFSHLNQKKKTFFLLLLSHRLPLCGRLPLVGLRQLGLELGDRVLGAGSEHKVRRAAPRRVFDREREERW